MKLSDKDVNSEYDIVFRRLPLVFILYLLIKLSHLAVFYGCIYPAFPQDATRVLFFRFIVTTCLNFWNEAWWFSSLRVFVLLSSSLLLFPQ